MIGMNMQDCGVKPLRLIELSALMRAQCAAQHARAIQLQKLRWAVRHHALGIRASGGQARRRASRRAIVNEA
jgi:hypothetical protein